MITYTKDAQWFPFPGLPCSLPRGNYNECLYDGLSILFQRKVLYNMELRDSYCLDNYALTNKIFIIGRYDIKITFLLSYKHRKRNERTTNQIKV